ncbi:hypothetical protein [Methylobacterium ajmalii]|uniref:hypothetical protein n=1 Tax=Methylobacterium ajmalii TaxID=2738439 RepID=UPI002F360715
MDRFGLPARVDIDAVVANSFKDFHTKGFDYLCVRRSPRETLKLYFFDGDVSKLPEVVSPHDHRYGFETTILAGESQNVWFAEGVRGGDDPRGGEVFNRFEYRTPLNGGDGFRWIGEAQLVETGRRGFRRGQSYYMDAAGLHTIRIVSSETVLMLRQFEDVVPIDRPTTTFTKGAAPSLDGLYSRFTADQVVDKLRLFEERTGIALQSYQG